MTDKHDVETEPCSVNKRPSWWSWFQLPWKKQHDLTRSRGPDHSGPAPALAPTPAPSPSTTDHHVNPGQGHGENNIINTTITTTNSNTNSDTTTEPDGTHEWITITSEKQGDGEWLQNLTPRQVSVGLGIASVFCVGTGIMAGIPLGMTYARSAEEDGGGKSRSKSKNHNHTQNIHKRAEANKAAPVVATARVVAGKENIRSAGMYAALALGYGTLLCMGFGVCGVYYIHRRFDVDSIQEFIVKMKVIIPEKRKSIEGSINPMLKRIGAGVNALIVNPLRDLGHAFHHSWIGDKIRSRVEAKSRVETKEPEIEASKSTE